MKKLMLFTIAIALCSCMAQRQLPFNDEDCLTILGRYDTSQVIKENFFTGSTTIIYLQDDSCIVIWGKKCEIEKGEMLYAKAEWWATPPGGSHWKYFLINEDETIRYSLLNR